MVQEKYFIIVFLVCVTSSQSSKAHSNLVATFRWRSAWGPHVATGSPASREPRMAMQGGPKSFWEPKASLPTSHSQLGHPFRTRTRRGDY